MSGEISSQSVNREVCVDNSHDGTDDKQKNKNLCCIIEKEINS